MQKIPKTSINLKTTFASFFFYEFFTLFENTIFENKHENPFNRV